MCWEQAKCGTMLTHFTCSLRRTLKMRPRIKTMMDWYRLIVEQERRRKAIERAAARHYTHDILRKAAAGGEQPFRRRERLLIALGNRLVDWGSRLQARYQRPAERSHPPNAQALLGQERSDPAACA
jgi:hypothetical protein